MATTDGPYLHVRAPAWDGAWHLIPTARRREDGRVFGLALCGAGAGGSTGGQWPEAGGRPAFGDRLCPDCGRHRWAAARLRTLKASTE
jgi:hypothetical protein